MTLMTKEVPTLQELAPVIGATRQWMDECTVIYGAGVPGLDDTRVEEGRRYLDRMEAVLIGLKDGQSEVELEGQRFRLEVFKDKDYYKYPAVLVVPAGEKALVDLSWPKAMAELYVGKFASIRQSLESFTKAMPLQMVFIIPEGMQTSGWVNDFGAAIMLNTDGRKYLLGREEAHGDHEAMHRLLMYEEPEVFLEILKIHPYLDESMAILASLLLSKSNSKGLFEGLPLDNEAYQNELMVEKLLEPLIFDELDGGQEFDTNLYCQWMVLAMFWQTLLEAKFGQKNKLTEPASVETVLKLGWLEMMDGWRKNDVYRGKEILNGLVEGLRTVTAGRAMSDESLLEEIFGEVIEAKSGESMKELLETKYLQLAAKNYLVWRLINTKDEYGFWGKQDERLRAAIGEELGEELVKELWHIPKQEAINLIFDRILGL